MPRVHSSTLTDRPIDASASLRQHRAQRTRKRRGGEGMTLRPPVSVPNEVEPPVRPRPEGREKVDDGNAGGRAELLQAVDKGGVRQRPLVAPDSVLLEISPLLWCDLESRRDEHDDRPGACPASQEIDLAQVRDHHVPGRVVFGGKENAISINVRLYQPHEREIRSPVREPERPSADEERGETADQLVTLARERGLHLRASTEAARHYEQVAAPEFPRNGRPWWSRLVRVRRGAREGGIGAGELRLQRAHPVTHEVV